MTASFGTLIGESALIVLPLDLLTLDETVIKHVDTDEVSHLGIHLLTIAELKGQILVFFFLMAWVRIIDIIVKQKVG